MDYYTLGVDYSRKYYINITLRNNKSMTYIYDDLYSMFQFIKKFLNNQYSINRTLTIYVRDYSLNKDYALLPILDINYNNYNEFDIDIHKLYDDSLICYIRDKVVELVRKANF